jgi:integrase
MVFRYAIATTQAERDPSADLRGALIVPKVNHRSAIIEPDAIGGLLRAIDRYAPTPWCARHSSFVALTFVRHGELRHAEWCEFEIDAAEWRIPS